MKVLVLLLHVIIYNYDTGDTLFQYWEHVETTGVECVQAGVDKALLWVTELRKTYPNASGNVTCS